MNSPTKSSLSRAWSWSVERSPLLNAYRALARRNNYPSAEAQALISAAKLPEELSKLIDTTVTKTKLWRSERADIAKELIAHTQDALDANRTPEHIIESFGNPKKVAKLLRRATKRKRPLYWRTLRNLRRSIAALTILLLITYAGLAARFFTGTPNITKNYAVMINSQNDAYAEDQKAWPVYKEIFDAWNEHKLDTQNRQYDYEKEYNANRTPDQEPISAGIFMTPQIPTDHHDYQETVQLYKDFEPQFKRLREATHRPIIGIDLGFDEDEVFYEDGSYESKFVLPSNNPEENPSLINLLLPHLGKMRQFTNILAFDTLIAARENDGQRTYEDLSAMLALARQKSFDQTLITSLVHIAIANLTTSTLTQVIQEHPTLLTRDQLVALSHELTLTRPSLTANFEGEIMMFEDILQRAYTDDGHGNGRTTMRGMDMLAEYAGMQDDYFEIAQSPVRYATGPLSLAVTPDRKTEYTRYHSMMDTVQRVAKLGPQYMPLSQHQENLLNRQTKIIPGIQYSLVDIILPALGSALNRSFQAHMDLDATLTMLAIEIYTIDHNHLPESLEALTPTYLPTIPKDLHNPGHPLNYKPINTPDSTGYIVYSIGSDADDDQGTDYEDPTVPSFRERFHSSHDKDKNLRINQAGVPIPAEPRGPDGDWVLIDMTRPTQKEPDQSPALESIN